MLSFKFLLFGILINRCIRFPQRNRIIVCVYVCVERDIFISYYKELAYAIKEAEKSYNLPENPREPVAFSSNLSLKA